MDGCFVVWFGLGADFPKFLTNQTIFYSWEGNPVNINCPTPPPAGCFTIAAEVTANTGVYNCEGRSLLEVRLPPLPPAHPVCFWGKRG
ncbi:hypothetical protein NHX12_014914 [Muraenolepis orangiensis]|uniref:Uncharacterized protein n=1 Tax=Muraenolepis orangiensis TaxID=630683 RepID=A0A9Q0D8Y2_9TELE|nr:hypothetical protein NHX12_014914 [Muraenolepis orangiensis]